MATTLSPTDIQEVSTSQSALTSGLTVRALATGFFFSILINIWAIHSSYIAQSSLLIISHIPVAALFPLVVLVLVVNPLIKKVAPSKILTSHELIIIFFLTYTASAIPGWAFSSYWIGAMTGPYYYASPENQWFDSFFHYLPDWLVIADYNAAAWFYEGLPSNQTLPWSTWIVPLFWWIGFYIAVFLVGAAVIIMLRKQWVEYERLTFPLAQIPLAFIDHQSAGQALPSIARQRLFWMGFSFSGVVLFWNVAGFFNIVPRLSILELYENNLLLAHSFPEIPITFNFLTSAVAFFTKTSVLLSAWVFFLLKTIQVGIMNRLGVPRAPGVVTSEHMGGFILFVLFSLWIARRHLKQVFLKAIGRAEEVDDTHEFLSYRLAVICFSVGLVYIFAWWHAAGMSLPVTAFLMGSLLLMFLGVTRIVAEAGLIFVDLPYNAHQFTVSIVGSDNISPQSLTGVAMSNAFSHNWRTLGMCSMAHISKMGDRLGGTGRGIFGYLTTALGMSILVAVGYTMYLGYHEIGAHQFTGPGFGGGAQGGYNGLVGWLNNSLSFTGLEFTFLGIGASINALMLFAHYRYPWWPLHPIGFAVAATEGMPTMAFPIFISWLVKELLLRIGGVQYYHKARPFVIGIIAGYVIGIFLSYVVDLVWFPGSGHRVHMY
ncbi:MAG TPA: hypothetical protein EYQ20_11125 [candidate division Zixibacteria bacterium]|nr:hypothetical protein [candidate division Zixibacteria bacterium]